MTENKKKSDALRACAVADLYRGILEGESFEDGLIKLSSSLNAMNCSLTCLNVAESKIEFQVSTRNFGADWQQKYVSHYSKISPFIPALRRKERKKKIFACHQLVDRGIFEKSEFLNDYLEKLDIAYLAGSIIDDVDGKITFLTFHRSRGQGHFSQDALTSIRMLPLHIETILMLRTAILGGLEPAKIQRRIEAKFFVGPSAELFFDQAESKSVLKNIGYVSIDGEYIEDKELLRRVSKLLSESGSGQRTSDAKETWSWRDKNGARFEISLKGLPNGSNIFEGSPAVGIVTLASITEEAASHVRHPVLTAAEQMLFELLSKGASARAAAVHLGKSLSTISAQRYSLYRKLGVSRQCELMDLVMKYPVRLKSDHDFGRYGKG